MFSHRAAIRPNHGSEEIILTARWVFPVAGPPLERGTVSVAGEKIAAVHPAGARTADIDLGNSAIIPGLVNAHTHLDLSGLRGKAPPGSDFINWLKQIIAYRREQSPAQIDADIRCGLDEALACGTTLIGDIAAGGASWSCLLKAPVWSIVFREVLGLPMTRLPQIERDIDGWLGGASRGDRCIVGLSPHAPRTHNTPRDVFDQCIVGLSPHAPYSVSAAALVRTMQFALPVAIHLAETRDEIELIEKKSGRFVAFLKELGVWEPESLVPSWEYIFRHSVAPDPLLLVHGNYLNPDTSIPANATVVYCPRTHAAFGHEPHPFRKLLDRGVRVALGTDSLASNPDLDVLAEARFIHERFPEFPGAQLLRMATLAGAEALGLAEVTGSLEAGKSADLVVAPLLESKFSDPHSLLFEAESSADRPVRTMWRGRWRDQGSGNSENST